MGKFLNVLVPVDLSDCSKNALRYAAHFTIASNAKLLIFRACHVPVSLAEIGYSKDIESQHQKEMFRELTDFAAELKELEAVDYELLCEYGFFQDIIPETISNHKIDLVIMGTHGTSTIGNKILGSQTAALIDSTECPVIAVPEKAKFREPEKVAIAYDHKGIENPENVEIVKAVSEVYQSRIRIVYISEKFDPDTIDHEQHANHSLKELLEETHYSYHYRKAKDAEDGLEKFIKHHKIGLLIAFHRERGFWENMFGSSFSKKLINHLNIPVLSIQDN